MTSWGTNGTLVSNAANAHSGTNYVLLSSTGQQVTVQGPTVAVKPGDQLTFGGWDFLESGTGGPIGTGGYNGWWLQVNDASGTAITYISAGGTIAQSAWSYQSATYTVPTGAASVKLYAQVYVPTTIPTALRVDDAFLSTGTAYYHGDHLGSAGALTDTGGNVMWSSTYLPFGQEWNPQITVNHYKFTGKERDSESGLDNFGARYDSSQYGRFMTPDPFNPFALKPRAFNAWISNPQRWNKYAYALNNPLSMIDPDGMNACGTNDDKTCVVTVTIVDRSKDNNGNYNDKYKDVKGNKDYNATATVSVNGKAVGTFLTRTVPSNGDSATIANGTYNGTLYNSPKHGPVILLLNQDNQNRIPTVGPNRAQGGASFADYVELHNAGRTGPNSPLGFTGIGRDGRDVSAGCVLVCTPEYRDFLHATGINPGDGSAPQRHFGVVLNTEENDPDQ